jgi:3-deoxy-7-phosphoheptulonate synthase
MIIKMSGRATEAEIAHVVERVKECGCKPDVSRGREHVIVGAVGNPDKRTQLEALRAAPGVEDVIPITHPFKLVSRQYKPARTVVRVGHVEIGGGEAVVMAGPCSVESRAQLLMTAHAVRDAGANMLRGGAPRLTTSRAWGSRRCNC